MSQINWFLILCLPNWDWQAALLGLWVLSSNPTCSFKSCLPRSGMIDQDTAAVGAMSEGGLSCVSWICLESVSRCQCFPYEKRKKKPIHVQSFFSRFWSYDVGLHGIVVGHSSPSRPLQTVRWLNGKIGPRSWWHQRDSLFPKNFGMWGVNGMTGLTWIPTSPSTNHALGLFFSFQ